MKSFLCVMVLFAMVAVATATQTTSSSTDKKPCEINVHFLVDTSGSIKQNNLDGATTSILQTLTAVSLRRGARVWLSHFAKSGSPGTVPALKGSLYNSEDAVETAIMAKEIIQAKLVEGGNTDIINGFEEVYKNMEAHKKDLEARLAKKPNDIQLKKELDRKTLLFVLTDGNPNRVTVDATGKKEHGPITADMIQASAYSKIFTDFPHVSLQFVLFGDAAKTTYSLESTFAANGAIVKVPNINDVNPARSQLIQALTLGGCIDPPWAVVFFENAQHTVYDYPKYDERQIQLKWGAFKRASPTECQVTDAPLIYVAGFASAAGKSSGYDNKALSDRRVRSVTCALLDELRASRCRFFKIKSTSYGHEQATVPQDASESEQKVDRNVKVYFDAKSLPDEAAFNKPAPEVQLLDVSTMETWQANYRTAWSACFDGEAPKTWQAPYQGDNRGDKKGHYIQRTVIRAANNGLSP